jgi:hypothetical protein
VVIARRTLFISDGSGDGEVEVRLFQPEDDNGMWICRYEIDWPERKRSFFGAGADAFQALIYALQMIGTEVNLSAYHKAGSLKWSERYEGYGFPLAVNSAICSLAMTEICDPAC